MIAIIISDSSEKIKRVIIITIRTKIASFDKYYFITNIKASFNKYTLKFKRPSGTSRGVLKTKDSWIICLENKGKKGYGECSLIEGLSPDDPHKLQSRLEQFCEDPNGLTIADIELDELPSLRFGLESALLDLQHQGDGILLRSDFTEGKTGIQINGLIWMGTKDFMFEQIKQKLDAGFSCLKLKIGAIDFKKELSLMRYIRQHFDANELELRLDANGAFDSTEALDKLKQLSNFHIHSIEQPIKQGQWEEMNNLCEDSPIPIALDEELIGIQAVEKKRECLLNIRPQYIILKPSLVGGLAKSDEWITEAEKLNIGWWATSALESNIGLNAIAQWTATKDLSMPQGLGTGQLFTNNIDSPLYLKGEELNFDKQGYWNYGEYICSFT